MLKNKNKIKILASCSEKRGGVEDDCTACVG